ncbi:hypothetical protein GGR56DRAFT_696621 [Xylariaceae sp. FL0804]|nr:hypothetical protein GGR56DRAFT_696621 [Xylariaceae sp. FL0804]
MQHTKAACALALLAASRVAQAHSWVEAVRRLDLTGAFTGSTGYTIGFLPRSASGGDAVHLTEILDTSSNPAVCKPMSSSDTALYSPLDASAGDYVALQYQENGHVTQPDLTPRPYRSGNVYVYGTLQHEDGDGINDVMAWTAGGDGGDGRGQLLATHFFDDGQCYQDVGATPNAIADARRARAGGLPQLFCQTDAQLPAGLPQTGTYTLMWVWDWPLIVSDTQNATQMYTSCAQVNLGGGDNAKVEAVGAMRYAEANAVGTAVAGAGIASQLSREVEANGLGVGQSSPPAPTGILTPASVDIGVVATFAPGANAAAPTILSSAAAAGAAASSSAAAAAAVSSSAAAPPPPPTLVVGAVDIVTVTGAPVIVTQTVTVTPPLVKPRGARVTGQARREAGSPGS